MVSLYELASKCIWRYVIFNVSYSKLLIVFPDLSGRSQDDDVQSLDSPVYEGESLIGQSSSEKKDTNGLTPEEGKFVHSFISIVHRDNSLHILCENLTMVEFSGELIRKFLKDNASQLTWSGCVIILFA